jgi:hypothetical protein
LRAEVIVGSLSLGKTYKYYGKLLSGWDAQFYYASARSLWISGDIDITDDLPLTADPSPFDRNGDGAPERAPHIGKRIINKYPVGLSLAELPWVGLGCLLRNLCEALGWTSTAAKGYGVIETNTVAFGLLLYVVGGLTLLRAILVPKTGHLGSSLSVAATWTGTSLFYYSAIFPFMAHGVAFALICAILHRVDKIVMRCVFVWQDWYVLAGVSSALFLIRPQQVLIVPIVALSLMPTLRRGGWKLQDLLGSGALFTAICLVLPTVNFINTGHLVINAYALNRPSQEGK